MPRFQAVMFDWAGTTVDYGSRAPARVFIEIFHRRGIEITEAEARGPMGLAKREHIATVAGLPRVTAMWQEKYGSPAGDVEVDAMYDEFLPLQKETLANSSDVIPGIPEAVEECRRQGIKIGSTTGYTRELMDVVAPIAARNGYAPDAIVCSDDVSAGRPAPWMNFRTAELLGIYPMNAVLIVDDTAVGITAGLNAGATTVAITQTGNSLGLSLDEVNDLSPADLTERLAAGEEQFREAGAHHLLRSVADLPDLLNS